MGSGHHSLQKWTRSTRDSPGSSRRCVRLASDLFLSISFMSASLNVQLTTRNPLLLTVASDRCPRIQSGSIGGEEPAVGLGLRDSTFVTSRRLRRRCFQKKVNTNAGLSDYHLCI